MSAVNCGCDPEESWKCSDYPRCTWGRSQTADSLSKESPAFLAVKKILQDSIDALPHYEDMMLEMSLNEYQRSLHTYKPGNYPCHALGLVGELGEVLTELMQAVGPLSTGNCTEREGLRIEQALAAACRVADMVKKQEFHGTDKADVDAIKKELGDVLWYVTAVAVDYGLTLQQVAEANIAKLRARYPDGFVKGGGVRGPEGSAMNESQVGAINRSVERVAGRCVRTGGEDTLPDAPVSSAVGLDNVCRVPPSGWYCTRKRGHEGPCAALPTRSKNLAYDRACAHIDCWYRAGERDIAITPQMFMDFSSGLNFCTRWVDGPVVTQMFARRLAYKAAIVYVANGWY